LPARPLAHPPWSVGVRGPRAHGRAGDRGGAAGLRAPLGRRASCGARDRQRLPGRPARRDRGPHHPDPARLRRCDAAEPPAAGGRRAVPDAGRAAPGPDRPGGGPFAGLHRTGASRPRPTRGGRRGVPPGGRGPARPSRGRGGAFLDAPELPDRLAAYRRAFRPHRGSAPQVIVSVDALVADTDAEARELALPEVWAMVRSRSTGEFGALEPVARIRGTAMSER